MSPSKGAGQQSFYDGIRDSDRRVDAAYTYSWSGGDSLNGHIMQGGFSHYCLNDFMEEIPGRHSSDRCRCLCKKC